MTTDRILRPFRFARPGPRSRCLRRAAWVPAALALLLAACSEPPEDELKGPLGPGEGGPAVNEAALVSHALTDASGSETIGALLYDGSQLMHYHPDPAEPGLHVVANIPLDQLLADVGEDGKINSLSGDEIVLLFTPIIGRPDTPCRFQAALLARDERYQILAAGDRRNGQELKLHEVDLINGKIPAAQRFYCYELSDPFGVQVNAITVDEAHQVWGIVHHVLNSVVRQ